MQYDVIIIGGSFAGLSTAMALGRSLRTVLIIDDGKPCNWQVPAAHNFITHDGEPPKEIIKLAKKQVLEYSGVRFYDGLATDVVPMSNGFQVNTPAENFTARKVVFATGIADQMPEIENFGDCWGISALYCPYCHGYEVTGQHIAIIANGDLAFEYCKLYHNWTLKLTLFTNGKSTLTTEQESKLATRNIEIIEDSINGVVHTDGYISNIITTDGIKHAAKAVYIKMDIKQHCAIPAKLGCTFNNHGYIEIDDGGQTCVSGIYAAGDNSTQFRSIAVAVGSGNRTGIAINNALVDEDF